MVERIDYEIGDDWYISFTEWNDFATAIDDRVLAQNFVLVAAGEAQSLLGSTPTRTELSRVRRRIEDTYRQRDSVDSVSITEFDINAGVLSFSASINSDEFSKEVNIGAN